MICVARRFTREDWMMLNPEVKHANSDSVAAPRIIAATTTSTNVNACSARRGFGRYFSPLALFINIIIFRSRSLVHLKVLTIRGRQKRSPGESFGLRPRESPVRMARFALLKGKKAVF